MSELASLLAKTKIVVLGDVILDSYVMGAVTRISPEAPVPVVNVHKKADSLGGSGNVALNLRSLGCAASLLAVRGADRSGERASAILRDKGIQDCLLVDPKHITTTKTRILAHNQQLARLDEEVHWQGSDSDRAELMRKFVAQLDGADAVILSDYHKGVLNGPITQSAIAESRRRGVPVFVDPKRRNWERYEGATCVTPNTSELEEIYGRPAQTEQELLTAMRALRKQYGIEWFLATRGAEGMCLLGPDDEPLFVKATATEVFDVSGAGDTVIATIAAAVAAGLPFKEAAALSNLAAGVVVRKLGAQPITIGELESECQLSRQGATGSASGKVSFLEAAQLQVKAWQSMGQPVVLVFGSFESLHLGHIHSLAQARKLGTRLVIGLCSDQDLRRRNGDRALVPERDRASVLSALSCVDLVVVCGGDLPKASLAGALLPDSVVGEPEEEESLRRWAEEAGAKFATISPLPGYAAPEGILSR